MTHNDLPVSSIEEDMFQRYKLAGGIAKLCSTYSGSNSLVVGLYGKWGEGKSSVLNFIEKQIDSEVQVIRFNPWFFSEQNQLLENFLGQFLSSIRGSEKTTKERIGEALVNYGGAVGWATKLVGVDTGAELKKWGEKLKGKDLIKQKKELDDLIVLSETKYCIFIDDIDRLDINEIQLVFKLVKLVADFPYTTYVLAFDEAIVAEALSKKYSDNTNNYLSGYAFLEKIIQLPVRIPTPNKGLVQKFTFEKIEKLFKDIKLSRTKIDFKRFQKVFITKLLRPFDKPRYTNRLINSLSLMLPLLDGEICICDLMIIEATRQFYPDIYKLILLNKNVLLSLKASVYDEKSTESKLVYPGNQPDSLIRKVLVQILFELFPQFEMTEYNRVISDRSQLNWNRTRRICSPKYFNRYFSYVVPIEEISDKEFAEFIDTVGTLSETQIGEQMVENLNNFKANEFIDKLCLWQDQLELDKALILCRTLAKYACEIDFFRVSLDLYSPASQLVYFSWVIIKRIDPAKRFEEVRALFQESTLLALNLKILFRLSKKPEHFLYDADLNQNEIVELRKLIINQYISKSDNHPFLSALPDNDNMYVLLWGALYNINEVNEYISLALQKNPNNALLLLKEFTPTIIISTAGEKKVQKVKSRFKEHQYAALQKVVDLDMLGNSLKELYKEDQSRFEQIGDIENWTDEMLCWAFYDIHDKVKNKQITLPDPFLTYDF